jgi:hypothetical protein
MDANRTLEEGMSRVRIRRPNGPPRTRPEAWAGDRGDSDPRVRDWLHRHSIRVVSLAALLVLAASTAGAEVRYLRAVAAARDSLRENIVVAVDSGGAAARSGLLPGDTLLAVNGVVAEHHAELARLLAAVPSSASCSLAVARAGGREVLEVDLDPIPPRLGATVTATSTDPIAAVADDSLTVRVGLAEWAGMAMLAVSVENRGAEALAFGPDSVEVVDAVRHVVRRLDAKSAARLIDAELAARVHAGIRDGADAGTDEAFEQLLPRAHVRLDRDLLEHALVPVRVPPRALAGGILYAAEEHVLAPWTVRVRMRGRVYAFTFTSAD